MIHTNVIYENLITTSEVNEKIGLLHDYIGRHNYSPTNINTINEILQQVTDQDIKIDGNYAQHPFLHQLSHQYDSSFTLLQLCWKAPIFRKYWDNQNYLDKYGNTALQRLSISLNEKSDYSENWIKKNMLVIKTNSEHGRSVGKYRDQDKICLIL